MGMLQQYGILFGLIIGVIGFVLSLFALNRAIGKIPPLAGFVGKFLLFCAAMDAGFTWLVVIAILNSVLSLAVYLRIVVPMYQQEADSQTEEVLVVENSLVKLTWLVCLVFTVLIGLAAQSLLGYI